MMKQLEGSRISIHQYNQLTQTTARVCEFSSQTKDS